MGIWSVGSMAQAKAQGDQEETTQPTRKDGVDNYHQSQSRSSVPLEPKYGGSRKQSRC